MKILTLLILWLSPFIIDCSHSFGASFCKDEALRKKIATALLDAFVKEDYDAVSKNFHASLAQTSTKEKLAEIWGKVNEQLGRYVETISITPSMYGQYNQLKFRCKFEKDNISLFVEFTEDDKILAFNFLP